MFDVTRKFSVHLEGRGDLRVTPNDHVASGGEGHIYRPGNGSLALKIWDDPHRAVSGQMTEKIKLLAALKHPHIVAPEVLCRDSNGNIIGYVMPWVTGWDLPVAFTNDWRSAQGFGDQEALVFASHMRSVTAFVHQHDVVMGDANELNILGDKGEPRYIDVDPWLPPGYGGDKIMPTIQDWHAPLFTKESDWFAWGVVTFQLLTGTHPYRGTHPDFKRSDLEGRMKANASVFDARTRLNAAVRPFSNIPAPLLDWYQAAFQQGERSVPPKIRMIATPRTIQTVTVTGGGKLKVTEAFALSAPFARVVAPDVIMLADGRLVSLPDGRTLGVGNLTASFARMPNGILLEVSMTNETIHFSGIVPGTTVNPISSNIAATSVWSAGNRIFAVVRDGILELNPRDLGSRLALLPSRKWALNPNATIFGDGAALFDALGAKYLVLPQKSQAVAMVRVKELDGMKPIAMIGHGHIAVMSLIDRTGAYHRAMITLNADLASYRIDLASADDGSLSDVILESGLVLWITNGGDLGVAHGGIISTHSLGGAANGKLIAGPSGVFCVVGMKVFRLAMSN